MDEITNRMTLEYATQVIVEIEGSENQERKKNTYKSYQIREGLLRKYVVDRLAEMFPKTYQQYSVADYSLLKKIVEKKAKSYKESPIRKLNGPEADTEEYQKLLKECGFNAQMKEFDKNFNEHKYSALAVFPYKEVNDREIGASVKYRFIPLAPYEYDVVKSNYGEVELVVLSYPSLEVTGGVGGDSSNQKIAEPSNSDEGDIRSYVFWSEKEHRVFKAKGSGKDLTIWEELIIGNENGVNPYGIIPIVCLPESFDKNYPLPSPLPRQVIELNALLSVYLQSGSMQVGQLVLSFPQGQEIDTVTQGIFTGIKLPQSKNPDDARAEANYISPNPQMDSHKDSILTYASMILDEQGIQGNQVINPNEKFSSGIDRLLASADVQNIIEDNQEKYRELEHEVFEIVKQCNLVLGGYRYNSDDLIVTYLKPKMLISDSEKLDNLKKKKDLGIFEDWELLVDYNPNLSEQDAKDRIDSIKESKVKMAKLFTTPATPPKDNLNNANQ